MWQNIHDSILCYKRLFTTGSRGKSSTQWLGESERFDNFEWEIDNLLRIDLPWQAWSLSQMFRVLNKYMLSSVHAKGINVIMW